jgi:hypothetical protein
MRGLDGDPAVEQLRRSTVGLYIVVGRAWRHLMNRPEKIASEGIGYVSHFIGWRHKINPNDPKFEELVAGAGGATALAKLIVSHIKFFFPDPTPPLQSTISVVSAESSVFFFLRESRDPKHSTMLSCPTASSLQL